MMAAIRNRFIDLHRRERVVVMVAIPDDAADVLPDPRQHDDDALLDRVVLERALAKLRPVEREVLYQRCRGAAGLRDCDCVRRRPGGHHVARGHVLLRARDAIKVR